MEAIILVVLQSLICISYCSSGVSFGPTVAILLTTKKLMVLIPLTHPTIVCVPVYVNS